jgi:hypothetical protein
VLIAEELLLLSFDPVRGRPLNSSESVIGVCVLGALVAELGVDGLADWDGSRFQPVGARPEGLLGDVHAALRAPRPRRAAQQLRRLDRSMRGARRRVVDGLVEAGVLGRERRRPWLPTAHPLLDPAARAEPLARVRAAAATEGPIETRTAVLLALSGPARLLEVVADKPHAHAKTRIAQAAELVPAADAVKKVIAEAAAAASVAVIAASTAAAS